MISKQKLLCDMDFDKDESASRELFDPSSRDFVSISCLKLPPFQAIDMFIQMRNRIGLAILIKAQLD